MYICIYLCLISSSVFFPTGRKRGSLEGVCNAIRMSQESNSLITLDMIYDGTKTQKKIINPEMKNDSKNETIQFQDLLLSTAFHSSLSPPPMNQNKTENLPNDLSISQKKVHSNLQNRLLCDEDIRYIYIYLFIYMYTCICIYILRSIYIYIHTEERFQLLPGIYDIYV
jgi:hypothetical protein